MTGDKLLFLVLFIVCDKAWVINGYRVIDVDGVSTILALENEKINIECKTDAPMAYCGFVHPSGKRYSITGPELNLGKCGVRIQASKDDVGVWKCNIGKSAIGVETMKKIQVRLARQIAAVRSNITVTHGKEVTLECVTTKGLRPLRYCRFEPPIGSPFSINAAVIKSNAILGKYFYPRNKSIDRGDCAVTIKNVKYEDLGVWTCGAGLDDDKEYTDLIKIEVEGLYTLSTASVTGITFGTIAIVGLLSFLGMLAWKNRSILGSRRQRSEDCEMQDVPRVRTPQRTPQRSPQTSRHIPSVVVQSRTPQRSPQTSRHIPSVVVQSPSEPGSSPLIPQK